jgi:uncharacterized protein (DUF2249 family)
MIRKEMKVSELLEKHPELLEVLAGYHPHFGKLRSRLLRKVMAPRVTLEQAARMAGVDPDGLIETLAKALGKEVSSAGEGREPGATVEGGASRPPSGKRPTELEEIEPARLVLVDVREDLQAGREPFPKIMKAVKALREEEILVLKAPFEPLPLYEVLGQKGYAHWAEVTAPDHWTIYFYRSKGKEIPLQPSAQKGSPDASVITLDVRGLPPPEPMMRVLEALAHLPKGASLLVLHERRPVFLYSELEERGFGHITEEVAPGDVRITIRRKRIG